MARLLAILAWLPATALAGPVELVYSPGPVELVHAPMQYDTIPSAEEEPLFDAPLRYNGLAAADPAVSWPATGVVAPDVAWWCDDDLGAGGQTTDVFTLTGTSSASGFELPRTGERLNHGASSLTVQSGVPPPLLLTSRFVMWSPVA